MIVYEQRALKLKERLSEAIARLANGSPSNPDLIALKTKVRINVRTVCKEANVSRTLISQNENCPYPEVRKWLLEEIFNTSPVTSELRRQVSELKNRVSELKDELDRSATCQAEIIARTHAFERGLMPNGGTAAKFTKAKRAASLSVVGAYRD